MEHVFKVSEAIVDLIQTDSELSDFAKGDFALGADFAIMAWNITLVNDNSIRVFMIDIFGRELAKTHHKTIKESKKWLNLTQRTGVRSSRMTRSLRRSTLT